MLFLLLIGACLSINHEILQPMTSQIPSSSLISVARTNPVALIKMLDGAKPETIDAIVKILRELIAEGQEEIQTLSDAVNSATAEYNRLRNVVGNLTALEGEAQERLRIAKESESNAKGKYEEMVAIYDTSSGPLQEEIDILNKVKDLLVRLHDQNTPVEEKELVELGSTTRGQTYMKLLANVQANPEKLQKIIGFVQTLLDSATAEHQKLLDDVAARKQDWLDATSHRIEVDAQHRQAIKNREDAEVELSVAEGSLDAARDALDSRRPDIQREEDVLNEVIRLLNSTKDQE